MKHKAHRKHTKSLKRRLKRMAAAAAVAGAAFVSSALLPGMPATAHASAIPDVAPQPEAAVQQMVKTPQGQFGLQSESKIPLKKVARMQAKEAAERNQQAQKLAQEQAQKQTQEQAQKQAPVENLAMEKQAPKKVQASPVSTKTPANAPPENSQEVLNVKATAYAPGPHDNEQWGDKTYMGTTVRPGVIAVDPKVIPLGSRVYIEYPDGTGQYAVAEDTGGAIKGNRIDIAMNSVGQAYDFGIKNVKVHVVDKKA